MLVRALVVVSNLFSAFYKSLSSGSFSPSCGLDVYTQERRFSPDSDDIRLVLYLIYFPKHLKYERVIPVASSDCLVAEADYGAVQNQEHDEEEPNKAKITTTPEWRLAVTLGIVVALHL